MPGIEHSARNAGRTGGEDLGASATTGPGLWAWGLCWLMFASTVLNYMDRQAIALVGPQIKAQFALDNQGYGWVIAAFQLTYAFFQCPAGYLVDRWNVRRTYAGAVLWWSLAGIATAFVPTLGLLMTARALLGMGESFNWPCALRVTSGILPPAERSLGNGIFNSGAAIGAVLTPLLITPLAVHMGWRSPFVILGLGGLAWVFAMAHVDEKWRPGQRHSSPRSINSQKTLPRGDQGLYRRAGSCLCDGRLRLVPLAPGLARGGRLVGRFRDHDRLPPCLPCYAPGVARWCRLGE